MTPESVQAMIYQALLRNSTNGDGSHSSHGDNRRNVQTARPCFYADFMKCQPLNFKGNEDVVGLTQWIEKMESVFNISVCAIENQITTMVTNNNLQKANGRQGLTISRTGNTNVTNTQKGNGANPKGNNCFECRAPRHFKKDCHKLKNKDGGNGSAQGWVYAVGNAEKKGNARGPDSNARASKQIVRKFWNLLKKGEVVMPQFSKCEILDPEVDKAEVVQCADSGAFTKRMRRLCGPIVYASQRGLGDVLMAEWRVKINTLENHFKALGTELSMSTAYHPEIDRQSEKTIQTLENILRSTFMRTLWPEMAIHLCDGREVEKAQLMVQKNDSRNSGRKPMEFEVGDRVMLKPNLEGIAYSRLGKLPQELSRVHHTFHVSNLKKCYADEPLVMSLEGIHVDDKLQFVEEPVENLRTGENKRLKRKPDTIG
ncbi:putative reverse transcriptase domain-containing protein [Tanacetum coccineum]|uniref:Reverse transcriptase domain-containing protein n=1 Tax=Tanacetum coccineum TaxID=301880 RepID=A0ABQ4WIW3_9ASTR